jgi:SAM-dependent methyltransferase
VPTSPGAVLAASSGPRTEAHGTELGLPGLVDLALGYQRSQVLFTAAELGIFHRLGAGARTADELAAELRLEPRGVEALLDACVALRILHRGPKGYENSRTSRVFLRSGGDASFTDALRLWQRLGYGAWSGLVEALQNGRPAPDAALPDVFHRIEDDPEQLRLFYDGLGGLAYWPAQRLATLVDLSRREHLLDVAGGSGVYAAVMAERFPRLSVTLFDRPPVCALARERFRRLERDGRFRAVAGDFFRDPLPGGCDVALLSHVLHDWPPDDCVRLLGKVHAALPAGGEVVVHDFMPDARGASPEASLFALTLVLDTPQGRVYTLSEVRELLEGAGFDRVQHQAVAGGTSVMTGRKER